MAGPADVDVFDGLFQAAIRAGYGRAERIKIHHYQIDRWNCDAFSMAAMCSDESFRARMPA